MDFGWQQGALRAGTRMAGFRAAMISASKELVARGTAREMNLGPSVRHHHRCLVLITILVRCLQRGLVLLIIVVILVTFFSRRWVSKRAQSLFLLLSAVACLHHHLLALAAITRVAVFLAQVSAARKVPITSVAAGFAVIG